MYRIWKPEFEKRQKLKTRETETVMLRQPSNGLLGSSFEWKDVQDAIDRVYGGKVKLGENKSIEPFAVGVGLQSLLGVIHTDCVSSELPESILLKIGSSLAMIGALGDQAGKIPPEAAAEIIEGLMNFMPPCHNSEIYFYEQLRGLNAKIDNIPKYYFGEKSVKLEENVYSKGCIGIEYIQNVQTLSPAQNFNDSQIRQVLQTLAKLEAAFLSVPENVQSLTPHNGMAGLYVTIKDWLLQMTNTIFTQIPHPAMAELTAAFAQILPEIISADELDKIPAKIGMKKVLVHGDLWSANLLWKGDHLEKIVDFQMIHFGLAATDLTRFFNTCLSAEDRKTKWQEYLKYFHDCLVKELGNEPAPYSYEQLELTYRIVYPRTSAYLLPPLATVLEKVMKMEDSEIKMHAMTNIVSKIVTMYADIIELHKTRPSF